MRITLKLFAGLVSYLPAEVRSTSRVDLDLPEGSTVTQAIRDVGLPPEKCSLVLLNGAFVKPPDREHRLLAEGDVLAIWPPVGGG